MSLEAYLKDKKVDDMLTDVVVALGHERPNLPAAFIVDYLSKRLMCVAAPAARTVRVAALICAGVTS